VKKVVVAVMAFALVSLSGCARFDSVGWIDLPDGTRLKAVKLQVDTVFGTDITHTMVYRCPPEKALAGTQCAKEGEFGGASASFLKAAAHGAGAGAAIGAGIALQEDTTNISSYSNSEGGRNVAVNNANAFSSSRSKATAVSKSRSSSRSTSTSMGGMMTGGGGD